MTSPVDISPNSDGGVLKEIVTEGSGSAVPASGDKVFVHYTGTLENGDKFDSSRDRDEKFSFTLGQGQVIKAWDIGVATMKRGERCKLTCRGDYAYGENGSPPKIPPNATLMFDVELFDWQGEDLSENSDGSIVRSQLQKGEGYTKPNEDSTVEIHIRGMHGERVFEERDVEFLLGEGAEKGVVAGVEHALKKFQKGEKSRLTIGSEHCYGSVGSAEHDIPPGATLQYEVTLNKFEKAKESWEMESDEKLEQSELAKTKGTNYFKAGKFAQAKRFYQKIVLYLESEEDSLKEDDQKAKRKELMLAAHLNLAMCNLKLDDGSETIEQCNKALNFAPNSEKAFFRRAQALMLKKDYDDAIGDFKRVIEIDPNNKAAKNQILMAENKLKQERAREKKVFAGMFSKFAEEDTKKMDVEVPNEPEKAVETSTEKGEENQAAGEPVAP